MSYLVLAPFQPTEEQWGGLARDIVWWMRSYPSNKHTPATLVEHLNNLGREMPAWMGSEAELRTQDHVISKGTIAVLIYKAMLAAAPQQGGELIDELSMMAQMLAELSALKAQEPVAYIPVDRETGEEWHPVLKKGSGNICDYKPLYAAPVSEAKAQGVVMPPSPYMPGSQPTDFTDYELGEIHGRIAMWEEVKRLNAAPVQQVSVPDAIRYTSDGELAECPCCGSLDVGGAHDTVNCYGCGLQITKPRPLQNAADAWNRRAMLAAAPAAPAANAPVRQATDGGRNQNYEGLFDGETEEQRASRLSAHSAKGVV